MFQHRWSGAAVAFLAACVALPAAAQRKGEPGVFDLYVLALSWSPQHCAGPAGARDTQQCGEGRRYGFIVHGLWPQYEKGWPQDCAEAGPVPRAVVQRVMPIMPSEKLIQHEWSKHGTCTAFDQRKYFETLQDAFAAVRIPRDYQGPLQQIVVNPQDVKKKFVAANSGMNENTLRIQCSGRFISELRVCMTKDLKLRACPASMRDSCRGDEAILRPVR